jgi:hypothetical protein
VWPVILALVIIGALITPKTDDGNAGDFRLTTHSTGRFGAQGLYEVLASLRWHPSRLERSLHSGLDTNAAYVILQPTFPISDEDDSALVRMVRGGGRLLLASMDSTFSAQFGMWAAIDSGPVTTSDELSVAGDRPDVPWDSLSTPGFGNGVFNPGRWIRNVVRVTPPISDTLAVFAWASQTHLDSATAPALMVGRRVGRGRVVFLANPQLLANDVLRQGKPALAVIRALEWLDPPGRRVVFDEYHHGFRSGTDRDAIVEALTDTPLGRVTLQLVLASLVLLVAIGVRPILPVPTMVFQRRSPLEHVDALARAYTQIHATRLGAQRLLRGIRRRHPMGMGGTGNEADATYLDAVRARYRVPDGDIHALTAALRGSVSDDAFLRAGQAAGRIEQSITTQ